MMIWFKTIWIDSDAKEKKGFIYKNDMQDTKDT